MYQCILRPVSQGNRSKSKYKWDLIKLICFCTTKGTINKRKRQTTDGQKIFANEATDKGLTSKNVHMAHITQ